MSGAYYNENDPLLCAWLRNLMAAGHIMDGEVDERSVEDVTPNDLKGFIRCHFFAGIAGWDHALRRVGWPADREVWTGSAPCQGFSAAGKGLGFSDPRHLWPAWFRLIEQCRPPVVLGEQVASKLALEWLDLVFDDMEGAGYACGAADIPACSVGAPHIRQRLYWVADSTHVGRQEERQDSGRQHAGDCAQGQAAGLESSGDADGLADSECRPAERRGHDMGSATRDLEGQAQQRQRVWPESRAGGATDGLEHPDDTGSQRRLIGRNGADQWTAGPAGVGGFWRDAEWIACRDGKARPTQPGIFPLAHGAPARVVRLRAYGNAIVPPLAEEFIRSYLEATCDDGL